MKKNKLYLILSIIGSGFMLYVSPESAIIVHIIALFVLTITACMLMKFDIYHPYVWYSCFFWVYSSAYPILYIMGIYTSFGYSKTIMIYQWLSLATILLVLPSEKIEFKVNSNYFIRENNLFLNIINNFILVYIFIIMIFIARSGSYTNKTSIYASENFMFNLAFSLSYFAILLYSFRLFEKLNSGVNGIAKVILKSGVVICLVSVITGERDYLFTFLIITLLLLFYFKKISIMQLVILVPVGILLIPITNIFKYYILSGSVSGTFSFNNIIQQVLDGEFISAGRNLQILVSHNCKNIFNGRLIVNDFIRIFYDTGESNQTWFNQTYFSSIHSTQYGFTLTGEGYVNGGVIGIVLVFIFVGLLIRYLYKNASKNVYFMSIYLYMVPLFIYSIRADLANILSPLLKYALLGTLIIWIIQHTVIRKKGV